MIRTAGRKMEQGAQQQAFVEELANAQFDLMAYISMMVGNKADARDVLQETNRMLWAKASDYDFARPFLPWARAFAHYEALRFRKTRQRDRLVFTDGVFETLSEDYLAAPEPVDRRLDWLDECVDRLADTQKELIRAKYFERLSVLQITARLGCSPASVVSLLYRIRQALARCIEGHRKREEASCL